MFSSNPRRHAAGVALGGTYTTRISQDAEFFRNESAGLDVDTGDFSMSVWWAPQSFPSTSGCLFSNSNFSGAGWRLYHQSDGDIEFHLNDGTNSLSTNFGPLETTLDDWHHAVVSVARGATDELNLYLDGAAYGSNPVDISTITGDVDDDGASLGHRINNCSGTTDSDAEYGPIGYWVGTALDGTAAGSLWNTGVPLLAADLAGASVTAATAYWDMDNASNTNEDDDSGGGFDMTDITSSIAASTQDFPE
jgi:hypothetical protein